MFTKKIWTSTTDTLITQGVRVLKYFDAYLVMKGIDDPEGDADGSCDEDEGAINLDTNKSPARGDY